MSQSLVPAFLKKAVGFSTLQTHIILSQ